MRSFTSPLPVLTLSRHHHLYYQYSPHLQLYSGSSGVQGQLYPSLDFCSFRSQISYIYTFFRELTSYDLYSLGSVLGAVYGPNVPMIKQTVLKFLKQEIAVEEGQATRENIALESLVKSWLFCMCQIKGIFLL